MAVRREHEHRRGEREAVTDDDPQVEQTMPDDRVAHECQKRQREVRPDDAVRGTARDRRNREIGREPADRQDEDAHDEVLELQARAPLFALLNQALGCKAGEACDISRMTPGIVRNEDDRPDVGDPFGLASTISQTFLLEYLEGKPMEEVAWGRLTPEQIGQLLEFHSIKFRYEGRAPYVAARAASPLARRMLAAMEQGPRLTVLVGHDTNIADLGGLLDLHWSVPGYPRDDPPPGSALGFEVLSNATGQRFVRAFYRSQTMAQVRELQTLDDSNPAPLEYLAIPDCAEPCMLDTFGELVRSRLVAPLSAASRAAH